MKAESLMTIPSVNYCGDLHTVCGLKNYNLVLFAGCGIRLAATHPGEFLLPMFSRFVLSVDGV